MPAYVKIIKNQESQRQARSYYGVASSSENTTCGRIDITKQLMPAHVNKFLVVGRVRVTMM